MRSLEAYRPLELVAMDVMGELPVTLREKRHVFVAIDVFTPYMHTKATKDVQMRTVTKFIAKFLSNFGIPIVLLTDNAPMLALLSFPAGNFHICR